MFHVREGLIFNCVLSVCEMLWLRYRSLHVRSRVGVCLHRQPSSIYRISLTAVNWKPGNHQLPRQLQVHLAHLCLLPQSRVFLAVGV